MITKSMNQIVSDFVSFRKNMKTNLSLEKARYIWGKRIVETLEYDVKRELVKSPKRRNIKITENKLKVARTNLGNLLVFDWVKFIGISGSIAAGFAKEEDDIDVFIVVRDGCGWIYRGILTLKNIRKHTNRTKRDNENVKDLFCVNYIVEERGLNLNADIFNMHELMYLAPIYNPVYLNYIYSRNPWLVKKYRTNKNLLNTKVRGSERVSMIVRVVNYFAYIAQVIFMLVSGHNPELKRLKESYKRGRIGFYPKDFKKKVLRELKAK